MKRLLSLGLASALVVGSVGAAMAQPGRYARHGNHYAQPHHNNYNSYRRSNNNNGAALAFGILALGTIAALAASNNNRSYDYGYGYDYPPRSYGPPPGYYNRGYGGGYGGGY